MPDDKSPPPAPSDPTQMDRRARRKKPASPPPQIQDERFEERAEIGKGGIGRVVEAWDGLLERDVAIKIVREDRVSSSGGERFEREAKITARLDHPNIVPVYDYWRRAADGAVEHRLAMKRIRGRDLGAVIWDVRRGVKGAREAWPRQWLLRVFQDICLGVAYAHSRGVLHRDLKPSNVMIGDFGETLIVDWGLAKVAGEANTKRRAKKETAPFPNLTMDGAIIGTPAYMSPEQAAGRSTEVDERSDVYALGAILYEILTLRRPLETANTEEILSLSRDGRIPPPSQVVAGVPREIAPAPVPPELEAICTKAMALRREDRHASARALHDDVQRFLDGALDRERRSREAARRVAAGEALLARFRALDPEIDAAEKKDHALREAFQGHEPIEKWRPAWAVQAEIRRLREERVDAFARAGAEFAQALAVDPDCRAAEDGLCELRVTRFLEAERRRDREEMRLEANLLAQHDREGKYRARLAAPAKLSLRAWAYDCDCLRPAKGWTVAIGSAPEVAWRDGRPRPGVPVSPLDRPVPAVRIAGGRFGHTAACRRRELKGVEVAIARYEERDKRLVPVDERALGATPLVDVELPQGSWRCTLRAPGFAPALLPVRADRDGRWDQDVVLFRPADIPPDFLQVPAGPFIFGGPWAAGGEPEPRETGDLFVAKTAVTCAEYVDFLNDLAATGRLEEARARQPRENDRMWFVEENARWRIPTHAEDPGRDWSPRWGISHVSWHDAVAYCAWLSTREGRLFTTLHEEEWEKCCRGVDGRSFSFGDEPELCFSHHASAVPGRVVPRPVGSFPADESPYGLLDMSGEIRTWCLNAPRPPWLRFRSLRGGSWGHPVSASRAGYRSSDRPEAIHATMGLRLVMRPEAWG